MRSISTAATEWVKRYRQGGEAALRPAERCGSSTSRSEPNARDAVILATHAAQPQAGTRRIRDVMRRFFGVGTSATTVRRVLREHGERATRTNAFIARDDEGAEDCQN
jgi:transposase